MSRIAIVGAAGQLGTELHAQLADGDDEVIALDRRSLDVVDPDAVAAALDAIRPDVIFNVAAYNFVDRAEDEPQAAYAANALGPRNLALWCEKAGATLLHVSSDYVFCGAGDERGGRSTPWREDDAPEPVSAYGVSKLAGEYFVRAQCRRHFVVRTCGLYGRAAGSKGNFVETMLRLARERPELRIVADQHCTPTSAADLAGALISLSRTTTYGLFHATNAGQSTWYEFANEIFRQTHQDVAVRPIASSEFGAKARRPAYSVLDCGKLAAVLGQPLPTWQEALSRYLATRAQ